MHAPLPPTKIQFNDSWSTIFRSDGCKSSDIFCKEDGNQTTLRERPYCNKWSWWWDVCGVVHTPQKKQCEVRALLLG